MKPLHEILNTMDYLGYIPTGKDGVPRRCVMKSGIEPRRIVIRRREYYFQKQGNYLSDGQISKMLRELEKQMPITNGGML